MNTGINELDVNQMNFIQGIVHRWIYLRQAFRVHAPKELHDDPALIDRPDLIDCLKTTRWRVVLADGTEASYTFAEFLTFVLHIRIAMLIDKDIDAGRKPRQMLPGSDSLAEIMRPERVRDLLAHVEFERA
jgi:hypothetical protein